ncbi:hypothetical protein FQA39_LY12142 [Lamprigera yunnana]|nr:hypothetical protein FQA39_LY12142 [Lamprigera yunnana]
MAPPTNKYLPRNRRCRGVKIRPWDPIRYRRPGCTEETPLIFLTTSIYTGTPTLPVISEQDALNLVLQMERFQATTPPPIKPPKVKDTSSLLKELTGLSPFLPSPDLTTVMPLQPRKPLDPTAPFFMFLSLSKIFPEEKPPSLTAPDMYFNPHSNVASTSTSSVTVTPKRSFATVFNDVIPWPHHTPTVGKRKKEYTPSVITSKRWVEYYELKEKEKKMKEDLKAEKKKKRELQKNNGKKPQKDEDKEEWIESGDSLDYIVINEVTDQETDIIFQVEDLKVGDYILALFVSTGKTAVVHYKYVATTSFGRR